MVIKWYWKVFEKCWLFFFGQSCCNSSNLILDPWSWYKRNQNFWLSRWIGIYLVQEHVIRNHGISKSNLHELFTCHFFIHWSYFAFSRQFSYLLRWVEISAVLWRERTLNSALQCHECIVGYIFYYLNQVQFKMSGHFIDNESY